MPRYLHTSIFVNDMAQSIEFYTKHLGLKLLDGPLHYPGNADMAFVGADWNAYIELVYDLEDHPPYELGNRYEHLALEVDGDLAGVIERLRAAGVKIVKEPKKAPSGTRAIAFVEDPNGIPVELLEPRSPRSGA
ncbi:MAG: VOC family protein [Candidatus Eremiobacteraeota bacterium]|nr:VOC family protein [Candidatus Eremiobacteraeota bacterium]